MTSKQRHLQTALLETTRLEALVRVEVATLCELILELDGADRISRLGVALGMSGDINAVSIVDLIITRTGLHTRGAILSLNWMIRALPGLDLIKGIDHIMIHLRSSLLLWSKATLTALSALAEARSSEGELKN